METTFILLTSVSILQFRGIVSASAGKLMICGVSNYGFEEKITRVASYMGYQVSSFSLKYDLNKTLDIIIDNNFDVAITFDMNNPELYSDSLNKKLNEYDGNIIADYYGTINKSLSSCTINKSLRSCTDRPTETDFYNRHCSDPGFNAYTKIFIGSFEKHQALYNVYNDITKNLAEEKERKIILVCSDSCPSFDKNESLISCQPCDTQFKCSEDTIAIVAPSPEKLNTCDENIPVIFYDTIDVKPNNVRTVYEEQYTSDFITSTTMINWKALASSLREYLNNKRWPRVAVVSDDSLLSYYMTNDQEKYFEDEKILFTIIRDCTEERDYKEAFTLLKKFHSRVIIVNVVKHNLYKFIEGAKAADVTYDNIIWVFPGHKQTDIKDFKFRSFVYLTCDLKEVVQFVIDKFEESFGIETQFKGKIRDNRPSDSCQGSKTCMSRNISIPKILPKISLGECAFRTSNYFHYCADWHVLYLILAIIVFLLLVFAILLFFNHIQMNTLAYKPLHKPPSVWRQLLRRQRPLPPRQGFPLRCRY